MRRLALVTALAASACVLPPRTTAASQPTPAAFDAAASDPRALAIVDAAIAALGGADRWTELEELGFELRYYNQGAKRAWFRHRWDQWNGRHAFAFADPNSFDARPPNHVVWLAVKYDLYNRSKLPTGTWEVTRSTTSTPIPTPSSRAISWSGSRTR